MFVRIDVTMLYAPELPLSVGGLASRELCDKDLVTRHVTCDSRDKSRQWTRVVKRLEDCHRDARHNVGIGGHCVRIVVSAPQDEVIKFRFVFKTASQIIGNVLSTFVIRIFTRVSKKLRISEYFQSKTLKCDYDCILVDNSSDNLFNRFPASV